MLLDIKIHRPQEGEVIITTNPESPMFTLAWARKVQCRTNGWFWAVDIIGHGTLPGRYETDTSAITAACDAIMAVRHHITAADGSIISREVWRPARRPSVPSKPEPELDAPARLRKLAEGLTTAQVSYTTEKMHELALEWSRGSSENQSEIDGVNDLEWGPDNLRVFAQRMDQGWVVDGLLSLADSWEADLEARPPEPIGYRSKFRGGGYPPRPEPVSQKKEEAHVGQA